MLSCPACHKPNPDENRFCGHCGALLRPGVSNPVEDTRLDEQSTEAPGIDQTSRYPRDGYDEADPEPVPLRRSRRDALPEELIEFDRQVPLIAVPGTDRRQHVPDEIREQFHSALDRIEDRWQHEAEPPVREPSAARHAPSTSETESALRDAQQFRTEHTRSGSPQNSNGAQREHPEADRSEPVQHTASGNAADARDRYDERDEYINGEEPIFATGILGLSDPRVYRGERKRPEDQPSSTREDETRNSIALDEHRDRTIARETAPVDPKYSALNTEAFHHEPDVHEHVSEPRSAASTNRYFDFTPDQSDSSVSGPSFLGIGGSSYEYEDEAEVRESHMRRNIALFALVALLALLAIQWRSVRDVGLRYIEAGTQQVKVRKKGAPAQPATAAAPVTADATNGSGKPNIEVGAINEDLKDAAKREQELAAQKSGQGNPDANAAQKSAPADNPTPASPSANNADQQAATKNPATDDSQQNPANKSDNAEAANGTSPNSPPADERTSEDRSQLAANKSNDRIPQAEPDEEGSEASRTNARKPSGTRGKRELEEPAVGQTELEQATKASDPETAAAWLWRATRKGNADAPVRLAEMYIAGRGVPQNCEQATILLKAAAGKRNARARSKLGALYATGHCVPQDRVQAYNWMTMALQVDPSSEWTARYRQSLWSQMSADEKARAEGRKF